MCRIPVLQVSTGSPAIIQMSPNVWMFVIAKEHLGAQSPFHLHSSLWHSHRLGFSCPGYSTINNLYRVGGYGADAFTGSIPVAGTPAWSVSAAVGGAFSWGQQCWASGGHVPHAFLWDELPRLDMPHRETRRTTLAVLKPRMWSRAVSHPKVQQVSPYI